MDASKEDNSNNPATPNASGEGSDVNQVMTPLSVRKRRIAIGQADALSEQKSPFNADDIESIDDYRNDRPADAPPLHHRLLQAQIPSQPSTPTKAKQATPNNDNQTDTPQREDRIPSYSISDSGESDNGGRGRYFSAAYNMSPGAVNFKTKHSPVRKAASELKHPDSVKALDLSGVPVFKEPAEKSPKREEKFEEED